jgi:hypothetical protein
MLFRMYHHNFFQTGLQTVAYRRRTRARDPCCLITRLEVFEDDFSRFRAAHIFPRAYDIDVCIIEHLLFWAANVECAVG